MTPRAIAKEKEYKNVLKEIKKAEKCDGKKPGTQLHIVKVCSRVILSLIKFVVYTTG